jgi:hypothetical protein
MSRGQSVKTKASLNNLPQQIGGGEIINSPPSITVTASLVLTAYTDMQIKISRLKRWERGHPCPHERVSANAVRLVKATLR